MKVKNNVKTCLAAFFNDAVKIIKINITLAELFFEKISVAQRNSDAVCSELFDCLKVGRRNEVFVKSLSELARAVTAESLLKSFKYVIVMGVGFHAVFLEEKQFVVKVDTLKMNQIAVLCTKTSVFCTKNVIFIKRFGHHIANKPDGNGYACCNGACDHRAR